MARKSRKPTDMSALLNSSSGSLAKIAQKTNYLAILSTIVRHICPDLPEDVWKIANVKEKSLVIEVNSAAWSQRLQFERMNICRELAKATENRLNKIEIKVTPYRTKVPEKTVLPDAINTTISKKTAAQLLMVAKKAPEGLRKKLEKLASHAGK